VEADEGWLMAITQTVTVLRLTDLFRRKMFFLNSKITNKRWYLVTTTIFGPIFCVALARLVTYGYSSNINIWMILFFINLVLSLWVVTMILVVRNARNYFQIRALWVLGYAVPMVYAIFIITQRNFPIEYKQILAILLMIMMMEWPISYYYQKIRLQKTIEKKLPDNAIDIENGIINLQKPFIYSKNDNNDSRTERSLAVGRVIIYFAPLTGALIYQFFSPSQKSAYFATVLSTFCIFFLFASGIQAGFAQVIKEIENKKGVKFVIKKLE
jgi:hypothetical protein